MKNNELIFYSSKLKEVPLLLVGIFFVFLGFLKLEENIIMNTIIILFFGAATISAIIQIFSNKSYLIINEEGFTYSSIARNETIKWKDIQEFKEFNVYLRGFIPVNKSIAWTYNDPTTMNSFNRKVTGVEEVLPDKYGLKRDKLMKIMNDYLAKYGNKKTK